MTCFSCSPPYSRGLNDWCGCNCHCCPPPACNGKTRWIWWLTINSNWYCLDEPSNSSNYWYCLDEPNGSCNCTATIDLTTQCGIEINNGIAYSIGTQTINYNLTDECSCIKTVLINNQTPPVCVNDGEIININIETNNCRICNMIGPYCFQTMFKIKKGRLFINKKYLIQKIKKRKVTRKPINLAAF